MGDWFTFQPVAKTAALHGRTWPSESVTVWEEREETDARWTWINFPSPTMSKKTLLSWTTESPALLQKILLKVSEAIEQLKAGVLLFHIGCNFHCVLVPFIHAHSRFVQFGQHELQKAGAQPALSAMKEPIPHSSSCQYICGRHG